MNILISTIIRDREATLNTWYDQLLRLVDSRPQDKFYISVYENDSIDQSKEMLASFDFTKFVESTIVSETLGTEYFGSIMSLDRVTNLANARNRTLDIDLSQIDKVVSVEPDVSFQTLDVHHLLDSSFDIYSARSWQHDHFYDTWATRVNEHTRAWCSEYSEGIHEVWSTYNCLCVYNSAPFKSGVRFSGFNDRLDTFDCDTVVICEKFREKGFDKIAINLDITVHHV